MLPLGKKCRYRGYVVYSHHRCNAPRSVAHVKVQGGYQDFDHGPVSNIVHATRTGATTSNVVFARR